MIAARRGFLASASGLAAALATGPTTASAGTEAPVAAASPLATVEDYAKAHFEPWPEEIEAEFAAWTAEWQDIAKIEHQMMGLVVATLRRGPLEMAAVVSNDPDMLSEFALQLGDFAAKFRGRAEAMDVASVRIICGLARHSMGQS